MHPGSLYEPHPASYRVQGKQRVSTDSYIILVGNFLFLLFYFIITQTTIKYDSMQNALVIAILCTRVTFYDIVTLFFINWY